MGTVLVLFGPKGAGKTTVARVLARRLAVHHVDADPLVLELIDAGASPDPGFGWLGPVQAAVEQVLQHHRVVSVENLGAFPTDWEIVHRLRMAGHFVRTVRLHVSKEIALARVANRQEQRAPVSVAEQEWIYEQAAANDAAHEFDLRLDTTGAWDEEKLVEAIEQLLIRE